MLLRQDAEQDFLTSPRDIINHQHRDPGPAPDQGVYGISVAAELCGAPIQSIRLWERRGLLSPERTQGGTRRYSAADLTRITRITALAAAGVNVAGITRILDLEDANTALRTVRPPRR
jgi:MerR family transcriptional regulator, heat shock protein HspR